MEQDTAKQAIHAWTLFAVSAAVWLLLVLALSYLLPHERLKSADLDLPWAISLGGLFVLSLMLFAAILVSFIWLCQSLRKAIIFAFSKKPEP